MATKLIEVNVPLGDAVAVHQPADGIAAKAPVGEINRSDYDQVSRVAAVHGRVGVKRGMRRESNDYGWERSVAGERKESGGCGQAAPLIVRTGSMRSPA